MNMRILPHSHPEYRHEGSSHTYFAEFTKFLAVGKRKFVGKRKSCLVVIILISFFICDSGVLFFITLYLISYSSTWHVVDI